MPLPLFAMCRHHARHERAVVIVVRTAARLQLGLSSPPIGSPRKPGLVAAQLTTLPDRSSWALSIPVSTSPTLTPPVAGKPPRPAESQPSGASMSASPFPPACPTLLRPYSSPKRGSLGTDEAYMIMLGSAYSTPGRRASRAAAAFGSPSTRMTWAPVALTSPTFSRSPGVDAAMAVRLEAVADSAYFTITVCGSYADGVGTGAARSHRCWRSCRCSRRRPERRRPERRRPEAQVTRTPWQRRRRRRSRRSSDACSCLFPSRRLTSHAYDVRAPASSRPPLAADLTLKRR